MSDSTPSASAAARPAPGAGEKFERLQALLREMFQLDRGDLDFGLYRIMNLKSAEIAAFLENDLLPQVKTVLNLAGTEELDRLEQEITYGVKTALSLGLNPDVSPKIKALRKRLAEIKGANVKRDTDAEADVYNHLAAFFSRYYAEGDFISQRRYSSGGRAAYLVPYDGEEVKLHWANADQYYVKTTENYAAYAFAAGAGEAARRVRFEIAAADNEKDNVKEANGRQRRFVLARGEGAVAVEDDELVVRFEHRPLTDGEKRKWPGNNSKQQSRINETAAERILSEAGAEWLPLLGRLEPTQANGERTLLAKHLERYTAKNSFDYFIHKDLGGFLRRELDIYLNTEALNLDDLVQGDTPRLERALARVRAARRIGVKIIDFLAQLEDFQKRLWLKKKFVLETNWCVTLDRVPEALYPEIATNEAQCGEWVELFAVDAVAGDLTNGNTAWSSPPSAAFLKANPYLVLDTRHFDGAFRDRLLAALSDAGPLDEQTDGLLVHGENFQALNLLQARYRGQAQCIHIDPPYNTQTSGFMYKNGYRHSSWLAMMQNRIEAGIRLLHGDGSFLCHIDENEYEALHLLFTSMAVPDGGTVVWDKKNPMLGRKGIATQHEYVLWRTWSESSFFRRPANIRKILTKAQVLIQEHGGVNEQVRREFGRWIRGRKDFTGGERAYQLIDDAGRVFRGVSMSAPELRTDPKFRIPLIHPVTKQPCLVPSNGWSRAPDTLQELLENDEIIFGKDETTQPQRKVFLTDDSRRQMPSVISESGRGKIDLDKLGLDFPYGHPVSLYRELLAAAAPKSDGLALDFFAGSGTTGHAIIDLNREDGGRRKYILAESGGHFDTALLPRLKKAVYSQDWKEGKPVSRKGVSQLFQYIRLESYEDTMDSLEVAPRSDAQEALLAENPEMAEDYRLRYALETETNGSACLLGKYFADPFAYTLSVVSGGMRRETPVDLPATFNYLLGLHVESRQSVEGVLAIEGADSQKRKCLILWRNFEETSNTALEAWFVRNRERFAAPLDVIYANGDHTLNAMRQSSDTWKAESIEPVLRELMFEEAGNGR